ncbi:Bud-site selection protein [Panaeolus papilionaceus]|nr:Bud-site selection protein [Panaeolus papilionaceus]
MDKDGPRGQKRKRYEPPVEHHEAKEAHKAAKRAKVFETQKIVKRLKDLRKKNDNPKEAGNFEAELTTIKDIDHDAIGNSALKSKILKDHLLRDNHDVKAAISRELDSNIAKPVEAGSTIAKIQSRLLSSKVLAVQVAASVVSIKALLDPSLKQRNTTLEQSALDGTPERPTKMSKVSTRSESSEEESDKDEDASESGKVDAEWESGSVEEGSAAGWESGSVSGSDEEEEEEGNDSDDQDDDSEDGSSDDQGDSDNDELTVKLVNSKSQRPATTQPATTKNSKAESTFLPSLSVGFVRGSDDSDFSEAEGNVADMPKKNRRGQRARRAIWEKKFGRNANHKKIEAKQQAEALAKKKRNPKNITGSNMISSQNPSRTWGQNAPNPGSSNTPKAQDLSRQAANTSARTTGARDFKGVGVKVDKKDDKPLHPSWEAKRRLKEKESIGIVPSQGKKIVF